MVQEFIASQWEADLICGGILQWLRRLYGDRFVDIKHCVIDMPWPPQPIVVRVSTTEDGIRIESDEEVQFYRSPSFQHELTAVEEAREWRQ